MQKISIWSTDQKKNILGWFKNVFLKGVLKKNKQVSSPLVKKKLKLKIKQQSGLLVCLTYGVLKLLSK